MDNLLTIFLIMSGFQLLLYTSKGKKKEQLKYIIIETVITSVLIWGVINLAKIIF